MKTDNESNFCCKLKEIKTELVNNKFKALT